MKNMNLPVGVTLQNGKYVIRKTLGQGGFGITYEAEQVLLHRTVAIKEFFMKNSCERESDTNHMTAGVGVQKELVMKFLSKFIREAQMIAGLDHPHIVRIYDVFEENGTAYYAMEMLGGGSLAGKIQQQGKLTEPEAEKYIRQIADALNYIHTRQTIHLDVKPSNILLDKRGNAVLIDFGVSKHYDDSGEQTSSTPIGYSKGYAPLEQLRGGDVAQFTPSTDIYSLGATLYHLLTGLKPMEATLVNEEGLARPSGLSDRMWRLIERSMQPRRKDRPQSIAEFLAVLNASDKIFDTTDEETEINLEETDEQSASGSSNDSGLNDVIQIQGPVSDRNRSPLWILTAVVGAVLVFVMFFVLRKPEKANESEIPYVLQWPSDKSKPAHQNQADQNLDNVNPASGLQSPDSTKLNMSQQAVEANKPTLSLGYGTWSGKSRNGKPHGEGQIIFESPHQIENTPYKAEAGDRLDADYDNGRLVYGVLYGRDGKKKKTIIP